MRPFFQRLGQALTGPDPMIEERRARNAKVEELQKMISKAAACEQLRNAPGWAKFVSDVRAKRDNKVTLLCSSAGVETVRLQSAIAAYTDVLTMMDDEVQQAQAAREELDRMIDEEIR